MIDRSRRRKLALFLATLIATWGILALIPPAHRPPHPYYVGTSKPPLVVAHRGGADFAPEGTLEALRHADALGADVLEVDIRRSADGVLVIFHDRRVDRVTDGTGRVEEQTSRQLQALDAGYKWSPDGGHTFPYRGRGLRIAAFTELLEAFPGRHLLVELKTRDADAARQLCATLRADGRESRTVVASFAHETLRAFRKACPEVATSASGREVAIDYVLRTLRLDGLYEPAFDSYHLPLSYGPLDLVDGDLVEGARARGLAVEVWTINREAEMERLIELGVDGIMTDRPDRLIQLLRTAGRR